MQRRSAGWGVAVLALGLLAGGGCVERTLKISTDPGGARVFLNDEEVGLSPVKVSFLWYGDYDIVIRKTGYETLKTHHRIEAPWHQWPPLDVIFETLVPSTIKDEHTLPTFALQPAVTPSAADLVQRATDMRDRTLFSE